jgi:8-amino-7-oxononanoate synthase
MLKEILSKELSILKEQGLFRQLQTLEQTEGVHGFFPKKEVIIFCSNDYLGLRQHLSLKEEASKAVLEWGIGSGASRLIAGDLAPHQILENALASYLGKERVILFSSGYLANIGVIPTLVGPQDQIFSDKLNHASIIDGCRLSGAKIHTYPHLDWEALEKLLKLHRKKTKKALIITEALFSMDGDFAPLERLSELKKQFEAILMLDEAHSFGVMGPQGKGLAAQREIEVDIFMATFGKAFGCYGAFIAGTKELIDLIINKARSLLYTTSLPPLLAVAATKALEIIKGEQGEKLRQDLWFNVNRFRAGLEEIGCEFKQSDSQIFPIITKDPTITTKIAHTLLQQGIFVRAIRPPTVPKDESRLRFSIMANHKESHLKQAIDRLKALLEPLAKS